MRRADDLEVVKLESEHPSRMLDQRADAQGALWRSGVERGLQVPHLDLAVVGSADDALRVEPDAAHQLLVALQHSDASSALNVPKSDCVVGAAGYH